MRMADLTPKFHGKLKSSPRHGIPKDKTVWKRDRKAAINVTEKREASDPFAPLRAAKRIDLGMIDPRKLRGEQEAL